MKTDCIYRSCDLLGIQVPTIHFKEKGKSFKNGGIRENENDSDSQ